MDTEFEIVFSWVNHEEMRNKIKKMWGFCIQEKTLMKRAVFSNPVIPEWSFLRVRDEWNRITCTYKEISEGIKDISAVKEIETEVNNMENMISIFENVWLHKKAYQESWRETWKINDEIEIMLDEWPGIKPFIEIEWDSEAIVRKYTKMFWFDYNNWIFGCVDEVYLKELWLSPLIINNLKNITFQNPPKNNT